MYELKLTSSETVLRSWQAFWYLEWHLDVLILWALASTGAFDKGEDVLKGLRFRYEYGKGNYKEALELLGPDFEANNFKTIGASDEQLDVFNEVWYVMLLNTGQAIKVIEVIGKRIKMREGAPFMWRLLERGYAMVGRPEATTVGEQAKCLETAYFNCWVREYEGLESEREAMERKRSRRMARVQEESMANVAKMAEMKGKELDEKVKNKYGQWVKNDLEG
ncbi:hypothetical protein LOK49_LG04G00105 [Camellia lanceoleosa]|uniref:Uncharacterized protein n=1 Tax=Camellia lanceoleosa TaxID=1840588 RepID=A0ACC0HXA0_9ERIC|nr:hypothetical protein LOK49_LG04G00105 [Camellia lanceoleosa]